MEESELQRLEEKFKEKMLIIEKKFVDLESRIEKLEGKEDIIESKIPKESIPKEEFKKLENKIESIYSETSKKINILDETIKESHIDDINQILEDIRRLKEEIVILKQEKSIDKEKIENLISLLSDRQNTFISNVQASLTDFNEKIEKINKVLEGLLNFSNRTADIATDAQERIENLKDKITEIENKLQIIQKHIIAIKVSEPFILE